MKKLLYYIGLAFIATFLFCTHSKQLNALEGWKETELFNFAFFDFRQYLHYIYAAAFAITTVNIMALLDKKDKLFWVFVVTIGVAEFIVVQLFNNTEIKESWWRIFSSFYYAAYTLMIIVMYAYIGKNEKKRNRRQRKVAEPAIKPQKMQRQYLADVKFKHTPPSPPPKKKIEDKVMGLLKKGMKQADIARTLNIEPYQVTRIKQKFTN
jgi:hypothetical protein